MRLRSHPLGAKRDAPCAIACLCFLAALMACWHLRSRSGSSLPPDAQPKPDTGLLFRTDARFDDDDDDDDDGPNRLFWLHIQKTGTSLFNTLYLHFCPRILESNPQLVNQTALTDLNLVNAFPQEEWCDGVSFYNMPSVGLHHPYRDRNESFTTFTMLRDPLERLRSAYSFGKSTGAKRPMLSRYDPAEGEISFHRYVREPQIPNCQIKMVLGHKCGAVVTASDLNVTTALERIASPSFFFGMTDRWAESICLFHSQFGGVTRPFELKNNRPMPRVHTGYEKAKDLDTIFIGAAVKIFEEKLRQAHCMDGVV